MDVHALPDLCEVVAFETIKFCGVHSTSVFSTKEEEKKITKQSKKKSRKQFTNLLCWIPIGYELDVHFTFPYRLPQQQKFRCNDLSGNIHYASDIAKIYPSYGQAVFHVNEGKMNVLGPTFKKQQRDCQQFVKKNAIHLSIELANGKIFRIHNKFIKIIRGVKHKPAFSWNMNTIIAYEGNLIDILQTLKKQQVIYDSVINTIKVGELYSNMNDLEVIPNETSSIISAIGLQLFHRNERLRGINEDLKQSMVQILRGRLMSFLNPKHAGEAKKFFVPLPVAFQDLFGIEVPKIPFEFNTIKSKEIITTFIHQKLNKQTNNGEKFVTMTNLKLTVITEHKIKISGTVLYYDFILQKWIPNYLELL